MKVAQIEAWHICILCDDMLVVYGLWQLHLVNSRIKNLHMAIKKIKLVISFDREVG